MVAQELFVVYELEHEVKNDWKQQAVEDLRENGGLDDVEAGKEHDRGAEGDE